jgi:riboflavin kinase/FMN adenylyltransferase
MVKRLRDEKKFSNIRELSRQIKKDIDIARDILDKNGSS